MSDIVYVYNAVCHNEDFICDQQHSRDPLRVLVHEMGGKQINLAEKEALNCRVNLQLNVRFLYERRAIVKCQACMAPLIETMVPIERFK